MCFWIFGTMRFHVEIFLVFFFSVDTRVLSAKFADKDIVFFQPNSEGDYSCRTINKDVCHGPKDDLGEFITTGVIEQELLERPAPHYSKVLNARKGCYTVQDLYCLDGKEQKDYPLKWGDHCHVGGLEIPPGVCVKLFMLKGKWTNPCESDRQFFSAYGRDDGKFCYSDLLNNNETVTADGRIRIEPGIASLSLTGIASSSEPNYFKDRRLCAFEFSLEANYTCDRTKASTGCDKIDTVEAAWIPLTYSNGQQEIQYQVGITHTNKDFHSSEWDTAVRSKLTVTFGALDALDATKVSVEGSVAASITNEIVSIASSSEMQTFTTVFPRGGYVWQWRMSTADPCGKAKIVSHSLVVTNGLHERPCCINGFAKNMDFQYGACLPSSDGKTVCDCPKEVCDRVVNSTSYGPVNQCVCSQGTPAVGPLCPAMGAHFCTSCHPGCTYNPQDKQCYCVPPKKICVCPHGTPASGQLCAEHGNMICKSCNPGFFLGPEISTRLPPPQNTWMNVVLYEKSRRCERRPLKKCKCPGGVPASGFLCPSMFKHFCISCRRGCYRNPNTHRCDCPPMKAKHCVCHQGTAASGGLCPWNGATFCKTCNPGCTLNKATNDCDCRPLKQCVCPRGVPASGALCPSMGAVFCKSCNPGCTWNTTTYNCEDCLEDRSKVFVRDGSASEWMEFSKINVGGR